MRVPALCWREAARCAPSDALVHARLMAEPAAACLHTIRLTPDDHEAPPPERATVAAWNVERGRDVEEIAHRLADVDAGIALLTELDVGMARSGNRDTPAAIAGRLGMHAAFAVEFVELGLGDTRETSACAGQQNTAGLHGNAVLSRWPIARAVVIPLDDGGLWFAGTPDPAQRRIGGRHALAALVRFVAGPAWFIAVHLESHGSAESRGAEVTRLVEAIDTLDPPAPVLIGGDLNTKSCTAAAICDGLAAAVAAEPLFAIAARHGFDWEGANLPASTTRKRSWHEQAPPARKLDWFLARAMRVANPAVHAALSRDGRDVSDHELLTVFVEPEPTA